jgi:cytochrome c nitrite reductase small subunit
MRGRWYWIAAAIVAVVLGSAIGLGMFTFVYARGSAYLGNDPAACANCHVMREHFNSWQQSSHHHVAVCNDCHAPPGGLAKYWVKAVNGFHHSYAFTSGNFPEAIRITERNRKVTESQCRHCHRELVQTMGHSEGLSCIRCHESVGHRVTGE